ncbi:MAG: cytochrome c oxidase subunit II [Nitrososphaerales archaeon]|nr:cytochrome c oxidase subunit II [Nitrososphaerales archaeon]
MHSALVSSLPPTTATFDFLFNWYLFFGAGAAIVVISMVVVFMVKYRARGNEPARHHKTEGWKVVLLTVLISISILSAAEYQTFAGFGNIEVPSSGDPVYIHVLGYQWGWNFTYPNGAFAIDNLTVPAGETVILNITSRDVFHTFGISMLAVKEDAIPGKVNQLWFEVPQPGFYPYAIRCFELCGIGHAFMIGNLTVVSQATWNAWIAKGHPGSVGAG